MRVLACGVLAAAGLLVGSSVAAQPNAASAGYTCSGKEEVLFDNTNGSSVDAGGTPPSFSTGGLTYCLTYIEHYHWNNGKGGAPGMIGLKGPTTVAFQALTSSGQGGAKNVNHYAYVPTDPQVLIKGTYACTDTAAATWSSNKQSGGHGFCIVKGEIAIPPITIPGRSTTTTTTTTDASGGFDLVVRAQPVTSYGARSKDGSSISFATEISVMNAPESDRASDPTTLHFAADATKAALLTRLHVTGPGGACTASSCPVPSLKPGKEAVYTLSLLRAAGAPDGTIALRRLEATCSDEETLCSNNVFPRSADGMPVTLVVLPRPTTVVVTPEAPPVAADVAVTVKFSGFQYDRWDPDDDAEPARYHFRWETYVHDYGPDDAKGVEVLVVGPSQDGHSSVRGSPSWSIYPKGSCKPEGKRSFRCTYPAIDKGGREWIVLEGDARDTGTYEFHVQARSSTPDPNPKNNKADRATTIH